MLIRSFLVDPIFVTLVLGLVGLMIAFRGQRAGLLLCFAAFIWLYALSTAFVSDRLAAFVEPPPVARPDPGTLRPQAIVVLSAGMQQGTPELGGDTASSETLERVRYASRLQKQTGLPVLVSGGMQHGASKSLAEVMADALTDDFGVAVRWQEPHSRTTYENAVYSRDLLRREGIETIYLVTHARHMTRATAIFTTAGFMVVPAPTYFTVPVADPDISQFMPNAQALRESWISLRELVGRPFYRLAYG